MQYICNLYIKSYRVLVLIYLNLYCNTFKNVISQNLEYFLRYRKFDLWKVNVILTFENCKTVWDNWSNYVLSGPNNTNLNHIYHILTRKCPFKQECTLIFLLLLTPSNLSKTPSWGFLIGTSFFLHFKHPNIIQKF